MDQQISAPRQLYQGRIGTGVAAEGDHASAAQVGEAAAAPLDPVQRSTGLQPKTTGFECLPWRERGQVWFYPDRGKAVCLEELP